MKSYDVIVLGGGIIGASIFHRLSTTGVKTLLVEKGKFGGETTGASAGMVRVFHSDPMLAQMSAETMRVLGEIGKTQDIAFQATGAVSILPASQRAYAEKLAGYLKSAKSRAQIFEADIARGRFPAVRFADDEFAFYEPNAGSLNPRMLARELIRVGTKQSGDALENQGDAQLVTHRCRVVGVETSKQEWRARVVVNALGPWAEGLCKSLGAPLGTRLKAIQANYFEWNEEASFPCIFDYTTLAYASCRKVDGSRQALIGIALSDYRQDFGGESPYSRPDMERAVKCLARRIPAIGDAKWIESRRWFDAYSEQKRGNLGFVPGYEGLFASYGWGGTGVKLSQGIALRGASLIREFLAKPETLELVTPVRGPSCDVRRYS